MSDSKQLEKRHQKRKKKNFLFRNFHIEKAYEGESELLNCLASYLPCFLLKKFRHIMRKTGGSKKRNVKHFL